MFDRVCACGGGGVRARVWGGGVHVCDPWIRDRERFKTISLKCDIITSLQLRS